MIFYLEICFWDNIINGVYSEHHKFMTIIYMSLCNILSSSHIVLSSKAHGVYYLLSNIFNNNNSNNKYFDLIF